MARLLAVLLGLCSLMFWPAHATAKDVCLDDPKRAHELRVLDEAQVIDMMDGFDVIAVPRDCTAC